jgi:hypothetical protein
MPTLMACTHSTSDPASRFRVIQWIPHLGRAGWQVSLRPNRPQRYWRSSIRNPLLARLQTRAAVLLRRAARLRDIAHASRYDVVLVNRDLLGGKVHYEQRLLRQNRNVVFDFDDAIFLAGKRTHAEWICRNAAWVTAGNEVLAGFARGVTERVTVLPTVIEVERYGVIRRPSATPPLRVGWCGSDLSIRETLTPFLPVLARLQRALGFELVIVSRPRPELPDLGLRWRFVEWSEKLETELANHLDVGIMPLADNEFERGKCGCKLLQYMASSLPAVASPVGINAHLLDQGRGFLAVTEREWADALSALMLRPELRQELGAAGRRFVEQEYSLRGWLPILLEVLSRVAAGENAGVALAGSS